VAKWCAIEQERCEKGNFKKNSAEDSALTGNFFLENVPQKSINQPINQSTNQPTSQAINQISLIATSRPDSRIANDMKLK